MKGVFLSGTVRGALINDKVCFVGDRIGSYEVIAVTPESVRLSRGDNVIEVIYEKPATDTDRKSP